MPAVIDAAVHRKLAADLFNEVWSLLEKRNRTSEEDDRMIHAAHASRFHWQDIGSPREWSIGEWQISRVYAVLRRAEPAIYHGQRALNWARDHSIGPFFIAYGYEALARAYAVAGDIDSAKKHIAEARKTATSIPDPADQKHLEDDLATIAVS